MKNLISIIKNSVVSIKQFYTSVFRSKYVELILAVALFILLDTGVLIINFYTSFQIANDAHAIQLASRMGTLSQKLLNELYQVQEDAVTPEVDYHTSIDKLADSYKTFDETLDAFIYGGELIGIGQGKDALLKDTVYRDTSSHLLTEVESIWKEYRITLKPIVYAYFNDIEREKVIEAADIAVVFARENSAQLLDLMQSFSIAVEGVATRKAERLRLIQTIGISLAVINFFLILFHFLRRLKQSDILVEKSRKETEDILRNVNEGLFLLDKDFTIGSQHSKSLHDLFRKDKLAGQNFIDLLSGLVSEKDLENVRDYTDLLFSERVNDSLISDLNPLDQVEVNLATDKAFFDSRYFSFQFSRVQEKKGLNLLLVTVKDITKQVQLAEKLKLASEKSSKEIDMLLTIIHVDNGMLTEYLQITGDGLNEINLIMKSPAVEGESLEEKLEPIFRIAHKLKGDSTTLGLDFLVDKFHSFEEQVLKLKNRNNLTGEDFLPLVVALKQLISDFLIIENLKEKMAGIDLSIISQAVSTGQVELPKVETDDWQGQMSMLVEKVANHYQKQAVLDLSDFDVSLLSREQIDSVRDIVIQSLRNAVAHGIEEPSKREKEGKPPEGNLKVALQQNGKGLQLTIRDDGQGLDLDKIKATAIENGLVTQKQVDTMELPKVLGLIFKQGFTTIQESSVHAGHGVGLDLIKSQINALNGKINLKFKRGQYTEFHYYFGPELTGV